MMKELQDIAWNCLPKEFKEEVKAMYNKPFLNDLDFGYKSALLNLFGHNLTSDAEGEDELLHVTRQKVMGLYANAKKLHDLYTSATCINEAESRTIDRTDGTMSVLKTLFGSKCLPDNVDSLDSNVDSLEPKPAEPKFKVGDKVRISCAFSSGEIWDSVLNGRVATIAGCYRESNNWIYCFKEPIRDFAEFWLKPCTEQETLHCPSSETECYISVRVPEMDEQRLNIATHITAAIYANYDVAKCFESIDAIVQKAVETADALIAGCKKE